MIIETEEMAPDEVCSSLKPCIRCKHHKYFVSLGDICFAKSLAHYDLVTGKKYHNLVEKCEDMRLSSNRVCGKQGLLFEGIQNDSI